MARGSITAPERMWAPTSEPFSSTTTETSFPVSAASCLIRMAAESPAGPRADDRPRRNPWTPVRRPQLPLSLSPSAGGEWVSWGGNPCIYGYLATGFRSNKVGRKPADHDAIPARPRDQGPGRFLGRHGLRGGARPGGTVRAAATSRPAYQPVRPEERSPGGPRPEPRRLANNPIAEARKAARRRKTLGELRTAIERFDGCPLKAAAKNTVVCDGSFDAQVMIVGEAPGGEEDSQGLPFVGRAGQAARQDAGDHRPVAAAERLHHQPDLLASAGQPRSLACRRCRSARLSLRDRSN